MKLSQSQIDTIIEGLENPNTRLESKSFTDLRILQKHDSKYYSMKQDGYTSLWTKNALLLWVNSESCRDCELVTETRVKI